MTTEGVALRVFTWALALTAVGVGCWVARGFSADEDANAMDHAVGMDDVDTASLGWHASRATTSMRWWTAGWV